MEAQDFGRAEARMTRDEALQVLGLKQGASPREVRLAYRELAQMLHPDKFSENTKLRARAEQQLRSINEARDVLLKGVSATSSHADGAASRRTRTSGASASTPAEIAFEAEARAHAAETARLTVVAQARTLRERRGGMVGMIAVAALVLIVTWRMSGLVGSVVSSVALMVTVWGIFDVVTLSNQMKVLAARARELQRQRDDARDIARRAREL